MIYAFIALWDIGVIAAVVLALDVVVDEWTRLSIAVAVLVVAFASILAALPWALVEDDKNPITLSRSEWFCTQNETTYVKAGDAMVPINTCIEYRRKL